MVERFPLVITHHVEDVDIILDKQQTAPPVSVASINQSLEPPDLRSINQKQLERAHVEQQQDPDCWHVAHVAIEVDFEQVEFVAGTTLYQQAMNDWPRPTYASKDLKHD
jgi:hypothetical protein